MAHLAADTTGLQPVRMQLLADGGSGNDVLLGGAGDEVLFGGDGADVIFTGRGDNVAFGGAADDVLRGAQGDDVLRDGEVVFDDRGVGRPVPLGDPPCISRWIA